MAFNTKFSHIKRVLLVDCGDVSFSIFFKSYNIYINRLKIRGTTLDPVENIDLSENDEFMSIVTKQYFEATKRLKYKYDVPYQHIFFVKDSPTERNWRRQIYSEYKNNRKGTRYKSQSFQLGNIFKMIYNVIYPQIVDKYDINIIQINCAEADDTISVITKDISKEVTVIIISSDTDYLQLLTRPETYIYAFNGQLINDKLAGKTAQEKLLHKVMFGDKSDNIPPCIPNTKLIRYYLDNPSYLLTVLRQNNEIFAKFNRNRILIDFTYIPKHIRNSIIKAYKECLIR